MVKCYLQNWSESSYSTFLLSPLFNCFISLHILQISVLLFCFLFSHFPSSSFVLYFCQLCLGLLIRTALDVSRDMTKPTKWLCAQQRLRSDWASAQSDQSLGWPHEEKLGSLATTWNNLLQSWRFHATPALKIKDKNGKHVVVIRSLDWMGTMILQFEYINRFNFKQNNFYTARSDSWNFIHLQFEVIYSTVSRQLFCAKWLSTFGPELFCLLLGPPGFNCWFSFAPVFQWCCSTPQGSPGVGRKTFLSSPHLCFIIVFIFDLLMS